ncbi:LamG-like jellyroll fold domain-containing protein [Streptomyces sp. P17]|uniref:LamG-like jellyroll fold domain-containing protein n=1 Tax=Streptomyces sp. P17 TaxID=3074716 RepID=UPI0028F3E917|nr:carbohydrate binding domain-containing protein [Streptomyces sp. P17]MDT9695365.1 carbohydrate binding domain-containing protein [Streptomyces sp. P17]
MARLVVDCAFGYSVTAANPVWTEITKFVDALDAGVRVDRGASDEFSETQPGTCTLTLTNADGRFTPGLASGAYNPNVRKNTPIRVREITTAKNLVTNPGFETDLSGWSAGGTVPPTLTQSVTHVFSGSQAMLITWGAGGTLPLAQLTVQGLDIGTTYTASAYVWVPTGSPACLLVMGGQLGASSAVNDAFTRIGVTFTATDTSHTVQVWPATSPTAGQQAWVDAVQVEEGSSATTFDPDAAQVHPLGVFMVNQWPVRWDGLHSKVTITCTDPFKRLAKTPGAASSTLQAMLVEEVLLDKPYAYYPLSEPEGSTSAGDVASRGAGQATIGQAGSGGTLTFGTGKGPNDGLTAPVFAPVNATNGKHLFVDLGTGYEQLSNTDTVKIEAWFKTSVKGRVIVALRSTNFALQMLFYLDATTGALVVENRGETVQTATFVTGDLANGVVHHLLYDENGKRIYIDGVDKGQNAAIANTFNLRLLRIGGYSDNQVWDGVIAHVALYADNALTAADVLTHYTTGLSGNSGESGLTRIQRLASYAGITSVTGQGTGFSPVGSQKTLGDSVLTHMRQVEAAESGHLLASRSAAGLLFQSRGLRYNQVPAFSLAYHQLETDDTEMSDDDQKIVNIVVASREGGATQRVIDQASIDLYGPYDLPLELIKASDNEVLDAANWTISRYKDPPPEMREVVVDGYSLPLATYRALLNADVSTVFDITSLPAEAPASSQTVTIEGYEQTIREGSHLFAFHVSRAATDSVWVLDSASYSQLGISTRLAY